ncbi:MAG: PEP/pyruvate-binding domain-containing protein, partial [Acidimicrobiia bacterium]
MTSRHIRWLSSVGSDDIGVVGGKNASIGEMLGALSEAGVSVPGGFATTTTAYEEFLSANDLGAAIRSRLSETDVED